MTQSNIQAYSGFSLDEAKAEELALEAEGGKFHKFKGGKNRIRVLPARLGQQVFVKVHQHFFKLGAMENYVSTNCPRRMLKQPCPVCTDAEFLGTTGSSTDYEMAGDMYAKFRVYANIIDLDAPELGPQTTAFGKGIYESLVKLRADETEGGGDFTDPETGFTIVVNRSGSGLNTKYEVKPSMKGSSPLGDMSWIEAQPDIKRLGRVPSTAEVQNVLRKSGWVSPANRAGDGAALATVVSSKAAPARNIAADTGDDD